MSVLLGTNAPQLGQLLHSSPWAVHTKDMDHALMTIEEEEEEQKLSCVNSEVRRKVQRADEVRIQGERTYIVKQGGRGIRLEEKIVD